MSSNLHKPLEKSQWYKKYTIRSAQIYVLSSLVSHYNGYEQVWNFSNSNTSKWQQSIPNMVKYNSTIWWYDYDTVLLWYSVAMIQCYYYMIIIKSPKSLNTDQWMNHSHSICQHHKAILWRHLLVWDCPPLVHRCSQHGRDWLVQ